MLNKLLIILFVCVLAASCASREPGPLERSQFVLIKNLIIQSGYSKIFFQNNGPIRPTDVNEYEPFCNLNTELTSTAHTAIEIEQDVFLITRIGENTSDGKSITSSGGHREGVRYVTTFTLESKKQPFIHSLNCQQWVVTSNKRYLSLSDVEKIIGNVGKFIQ